MEMLYFRGLFAVGLVSLAFSSQGLAACSPPLITSPPQPLTVTEGCPAVFQVQATGTAPVTFQWFESGAAITNATNAVYTKRRVARIDNGLAYTVVVSNSCGVIASTPVVLSVVLGATPPQLLGAAPGTMLDQIVLSFTTTCNGGGIGLEPASAQVAANYTVSGGLTVTNAQLTCSGTNVLLTLTSRATESSSYTVTVSGVTDQLGNAVAPGSQATFRAAALFRHALRRELLWNVTGGLSGALDETRWTCPDQANWQTSFETPRHIGEHYAQRLVGLLLHPVTTNYTFALAANEQAVLYLSPDESPANKRMIALCTTPLQPRSWSCDGQTACSNRSAALPLEAGKRYYVEALMAEDSGEDHLAVAWTWPGSPPLRDGYEPIPGTYLGAYGPAGASGSQITISQPPQNMTCIADGQATFSIGATVTPNPLPMTYQWQRNSVDLPGANSATYVTPRLTPADNLTVYRCFVRAPGLSRTSANAFLTVSAGDPAAPALLGATSLQPNVVLALFSEPISFPGPDSFIVNGTPCVQARLNGDDASVVELAVSPVLSAGTRNSLDVQNVTDSSGNSMPLSTVIFVSQPPLASQSTNLRATAAGHKAVLEWSQGVLLASPGLEGPWSDLPDAKSPCVLETHPFPCSAPSLGTYFRLRVGPSAGAP